MTEVTITTRWEAVTYVEVESEEEADVLRGKVNQGSLGAIPDEVIDVMDANGASLVDWSA